MRLASIVFPAPGGPIKIMLWPPAQATSRARLAACCPRTSRMSTAYCAASASIVRASTRTGVKRFRHVDQVHGLRQRFARRTRRCLRRPRLRARSLPARPGLGSRARAPQAPPRAHRAPSARCRRAKVRREKCIDRAACRRTCPGSPESTKRHGQIEGRAFLANVGGREIDGDALVAGKSKPQFFSAALMRSRLSFTAMSGRPTTLKSPGCPGPTSTSTSTR